MTHFQSFFKPIGLIMVLSILFQGCMIYYKQAVTLKQAFESSGGVKIIFVDNRNAYFDRIKIEDYPFENE